MTQEEINMRKKAIAIFEGFEAIDDCTFKKNGVEIDRGRFRYDSSFDILIPVAQKILGAELNDIYWYEMSEQLGFYTNIIDKLTARDGLIFWFKDVSDFCIEWCKQNNKPL